MHTHTNRLIQSYSKIDSNLISQLVRERESEREEEAKIYLHFNRMVSARQTHTNKRDMEKQ